MATLSIRGLDDKALAALKKRAAQEDASVNALVVRLIEQGLGLRSAKSAVRRHDDLDALAGQWTKAQAAEFARATEAFNDVDARLWKLGQQRVRPVLVDTNAYTALMLGEPDVVEVLTHADRLLLNSVVLGELLGGFAAGTCEARNRAGLSRFLDSPRVEVLPITASTADSYALVVAGLRRKGRPIPTNDLRIAASALEHGAALLTRDSHFSQVDGLRTGQRIDDFLP